MLEEVRQKLPRGEYEKWRRKVSKSKPVFTLSLSLSLCLIPILINLIFPPSSFALTEEETLTITTYYPAPYGVYNEMRAKRMAVGANYYNGSAYPWNTGGPCTGNEICKNTDLVVQGRVGIGTEKPGAKLDISGKGNDEYLWFSAQSAGEPQFQSWYNSVGTRRGYLGYASGGSPDFTIMNQEQGSTKLYTSNLERMRIDGSGNVGIGIASPSERLDVLGNVRVSGGSRQSGTGGEVLRIIRGRVSAGGGPSVGSSAFNSSWVNQGRYLITFQTPFSSAPVISATVYTQNDTDCRIATVNTVSSGGFRAIIQACNSDYKNDVFDFIAIGVP